MTRFIKTKEISNIKPDSKLRRYINMSEDKIW